MIGFEHESITSVLNGDGRAQVVIIPPRQNANRIAENYTVLATRHTFERTEERRDVENDFVKHEAFVLGKLKFQCA